MTAPLALLVLAAPALLVGVTVAAARRPGAHPVGVIRLATVATWSGVAVAVVAAATTAVTGTTTSPTIGVAGLGLAVRLDGLSLAMFVMVALLAVVILRYSVSYLDGDPGHGRFLGALAATVAAVEVLVLAGNLAQLAAGWVLTSLALHHLLLFYGDRPRARVAARKKFVTARVADVFLVGACVALYAFAGTGDLGTVFDRAAAAVAAADVPALLVLAAVSLAVAALVKSAQMPTHSWLIEVMESPTPVSALLHAGILNAGPFLVLRMAFVVDGTPPAAALLLVVGGATAVLASVALLSQPSVKAALAYSSVAHMGFMLFVCGMGLYPAALLHLVAHSFYKAHAFLSSGSVVDEARAAGVRPPRRLGSPARIVASLLVAAGVFAAFAWVWRVDVLADPMLVAMGAMLVLGTTQLMAPAVDADGRGRDVLRVAGMAAGVTAAFFTLEAGAHHLLASTLPEEVARPAALVAIVAAVITVMAVVIGLQIIEPARPSGPRRRALAVHLRNGLYAGAVLDRLVGALRLPDRAGARP